LQIAVTGLVTPYRAEVYETRPDGAIVVWPWVSLSSPFDFGPTESGDRYFGVEQTGLSQAQVVVNGAVSNGVRWGGGPARPALAWGWRFPGRLWSGWAGALRWRASRGRARRLRCG